MVLIIINLGTVSNWHTAFIWFIRWPISTDQINIFRDEMTDLKYKSRNEKWKFQLIEEHYQFQFWDQCQRYRFQDRCFLACRSTDRSPYQTAPCSYPHKHGSRSRCCVAASTSTKKRNRKWGCQPGQKWSHDPAPSLPLKLAGPPSALGGDPPTDTHGLCPQAAEELRALENLSSEVRCQIHDLRLITNFSELLVPYLQN